MAQFKILIPRTARLLIAEVNALLGHDFGIPMEIEIPERNTSIAWEPVREGRATVVFPQYGKLTMDVLIHCPAKGAPRVRIVRMDGALRFASWKGDAWIRHVQGIGGGFTYNRRLEGDQACYTFTLEGSQLARLQLEADAKRHGLPALNAG